MSLYRNAPTSTTDVRPENIPGPLKAEDRWVCWMYVRRNGKRVKVPVNPNFTGRLAKTDDPSTWASFDLAYARFRANPKLAGIGYVFSKDDEYCGVDFDSCIHDGVVDDFAAAWLSKLDGYVERSVSGTGIHAVVKARLPKGTRHVKNNPGGQTEKVELYDRLRYFTFSGDVFGDSFDERGDSQDAINELLTSLFPPKPRRKPKPRMPTNLDDTELLERARNSAHAQKFMNLYDKGDISGHNNDHSSADFALIHMLNFWAGGDRERVIRLFESSALYRDEGKHPRYVELSVDNALKQYTGDFYNPEKTQRAVDKVLPEYFALLLSPIWTDRRAVSAFKAFAGLLDLAPERGVKIEEGIRIGVDIRTLAEICNVGWDTLSRNTLPFLIKQRLVRWVRGKGTRAGYFVLLTPKVRAYNTSNTRGDIYSVGGSHLAKARQLIRLCYGQPSKKYPKARLGSLAAIVLLPLALTERELSVVDIAEITGRRVQDLRRGVLRKLVDAGLVVQAREGVYRLPVDFWDRLQEELETSGITEAERLRKFRHDNHREGYKRWLEAKKKKGFSPPESEQKEQVPPTSDWPEVVEAAGDGVIRSTAEVFEMAQRRFLNREGLPDYDALVTARSAALNEELDRPRDPLVHKGADKANFFTGDRR